MHKPAVKLAQRPGPGCCCCGWKTPFSWIFQLLHQHLAALLGQLLAGCCLQDLPAEGQEVEPAAEASSTGWWQWWQAGKGTVPSARCFSQGHLSHGSDRGSFSINGCGFVAGLVYTFCPYFYFFSSFVSCQLSQQAHNNPVTSPRDTHVGLGTSLLPLAQSRVCQKPCLGRLLLPSSWHYSTKENTYQSHLVPQDLEIILQHLNDILPWRLWKQTKAVLERVFRDAKTIIGRNYLQTEEI